MKRHELEAWLAARGWAKDRWGHYTKTSAGPEGEERAMRYKLSRVGARLEIKAKIGQSHEWVRLRYGFFTKLTFAPDGKLKGMAR